MQQVINIILSFLVSCVYVSASTNTYLIVNEVTPNKDDAKISVCLMVSDIQDASNTLAEVESAYFDGIEYKAYYHIHRISEPIPPCESIPLKVNYSIIATIETVVGANELPEYVTVKCLSKEDADIRLKDIKKSKHFKDKQTTTKVKSK